MVCFDNRKKQASLVHDFNQFGTFSQSGAVEGLLCAKIWDHVVNIMTELLNSCYAFAKNICKYGERSGAL